MKPLLVFLVGTCLSLSSFHVFAQTDTVYFDKDWNKTEHMSAYYYRLAAKDNNGGYNVEDHYIFRKKLQMSGHYSSLDPEVKDGDFAFYNEKGIKTSEEHYVANKQEGALKLYNDTTGALLEIYNYSKGKKNGPYVRFFSNGKKEIEGKYKNNDLAGTWKHYYEDVDTVWYTETFNEDGDRKTLSSYYKNGKLKREEVDRKSVAVRGKCWDEKGNEIKFTPFEKLPVFPNLENYITTHMGYPESSMTKHIQGRVVVKFIVNEDGHVSDVTVAKSVDPVLDEEAMQVVKNMPPWTPGVKDDTLVKTYFTLPVNFKL